MGCVVYCMSLALSCSISSAGQNEAPQSECLTVFVVCCIDVPCCLECVWIVIVLPSATSSYHFVKAHSGNYTICICVWLTFYDPEVISRRRFRQISQNVHLVYDTAHE